ncbi:MAG: sugar ABC transporter ATP-binding protein [Verrucomicrobia bacterium]|nr:MAG: sugar ABC transporter ATP-binding protein [Verrucomicrobiota bacterium]
MPPLLNVSALRKSYSVPVLTDFSFDLERGEVHALIGSNGAGKSTFARILCGLTMPDSGEVQLEGRQWKPRSKIEAEHSGIVMVLQELNVIGTLSVAENIFLNRLPRGAGFVRYSLLHQQARQALARVGLGDLDPAMPAERLGVGHQQLVEIAGALALNCRILILDEPTAALTDPEIERLFENIRKLQREGVGVIYISHRMDEIRRIAGRVTVLRDGRRVATHPADQTAPTELVREMVGHDLPERKQASQRVKAEVALRVSNMNAGDRVRNVSFEVHRGEILGIAGLIGSGRTETLRAIFGAEPKESGQVFVGRVEAGEASPSRMVRDVPTSSARSTEKTKAAEYAALQTLRDPDAASCELRRVVIRQPADAVRAGIGMVPEDRKQQGLLLSQSVRVNTTLATLPRHSRRAGWLDTRAETATSSELCKRLAVRCASMEQPVSELSGGTQQKVVVARWLARDCQVLLFDEPTRGIDVAAKDAIYQLLRDLAGEGKALVVVSSELTELMALCDRILVMSNGALAGEFLPGQWTQEAITQAAFSGYLESSRK